MQNPQTAEKPDWLKAWEADPQPKRPVAGNPAWVGCPSPNPAGRPPGSTPQTKLVQRMLENADGILDALIEKAMEGDTSAASLILSRIIPSLRAQSEKVAFPFDAAAPITQQVEMILDAAANGHVAPDVGKQIIEAVKALSDLRATQELEQRIIILESRQMLHADHPYERALVGFAD
ncbi:MAG: hypothetical protein M3Y27_02305 [Acidobacteriota bacterium]|nr:hypothetical protein [Acidobacteriota bacterium]